MDGDTLSRRIIVDKDLTWPTALAVDTIIQRLYFVDTKSQRIETIKYDGTGRKTLVSKGLAHPLGLAVFEDRLYYTDYSLHKISIVDKRTGERAGELKENVKRPTGINIVHPLNQKQGIEISEETGWLAGHWLDDVKDKIDPDYFDHDLVVVVVTMSRWSMRYRATVDISLQSVKTDLNTAQN